MAPRVLVLDTWWSWLLNYTSWPLCSWADNTLGAGGGPEWYQLRIEPSLLGF